MKPTTTKLELKALVAAYRSASRNGHDFGFVEDVVKALRPMKAQAVGALLTSLSKKDVLHVWEPVTTDAGTFTQFTWAEGVDLDYIAALGQAAEDAKGGLDFSDQPAPGVATEERRVMLIKKVRTASTEQLIADLKKFRAAREHPETSAAMRREIQNYVRPIVQELRDRQRDLSKLVTTIAKAI